MAENQHAAVGCIIFNTQLPHKWPMCSNWILLLVYDIQNVKETSLCITEPNYKTVFHCQTTNPTGNSGNLESGTTHSLLDSGLLRWTFVCFSMCTPEKSMIPDSWAVYWRSLHVLSSCFESMVRAPAFVLCYPALFYACPTWERFAHGELSAAVTGSCWRITRCLTLPRTILICLPRLPFWIPREHSQIK